MSAGAQRQGDRGEHFGQPRVREWNILQLYTVVKAYAVCRFALIRHQGCINNENPTLRQPGVLFVTLPLLQPLLKLCKQLS